MHELAANAAKYGALSVDEGKVDLHWSVNGVDKERSLTVVWQEKNTPLRKRSVKRGFGSVLIDNSIPNATVRREFAPKGLTCTIVLPLPSAGQDEAASPS